MILVFDDVVLTYSYNTERYLGIFLLKHIEFISCCFPSFVFSMPHFLPIEFYFYDDNINDKRKIENLGSEIRRKEELGTKRIRK